MYPNMGLCATYWFIYFTSHIHQKHNTCTLDVYIQWMLNTAFSCWRKQHTSTAYKVCMYTYNFCEHQISWKLKGWAFVYDMPTWKRVCKHKNTYLSGLSYIILWCDVMCVMPQYSLIIWSWRDEHLYTPSRHEPCLQQAHISIRTVIYSMIWWEHLYTPCRHENLSTWTHIYDIYNVMDLF
jgi:hypothetical protein